MEVGMDKTGDVTIPVEPEVAADLADARNRAAVGRLVSRVLRPRSGPSALAQAIAELKAEARGAGLTDADIDAELAAYNAERRDRTPSIDASAVVSAALKADSAPERALLRAEEVDVFALSAAVDAPLSAATTIFSYPIPGGVYGYCNRRTTSRSPDAREGAKRITDPHPP